MKNHYMHIALFQLEHFKNDTELQDISDINGENSSLIQKLVITMKSLYLTHLK